MIQSLHIRNYAIIEELEIRFSRGLTIITGETGAGKSILLGALGLIMGKRADTKSLYDQSAKCVIEGTFDVSKYDLRAFFEENDLDYEDETNVRREITPSGKSRAFVNDTPVKLGVLQQLSGALIDLHQQFDTLDIHNVSFQLRMMDALAGNQSLLATYQKSFKFYRRDQKRLAELIHRSNTAANEMDFIEFQLNEFNEAELIAGEQAKMEADLQKLSNAEDIKRSLSAIYQHISESEQSVVGQLQELETSLNNVKKYDLRIEQLATKLEGLNLELQDVAQEFEKIAEATEYDPERIQEMQTRLDLIYRLQAKHQVQSVEELIHIQDNLAEQLQSFGDLSGEIAALEEKINEQEQELSQIAAKLSKKRKGVTAGFERKVHTLLSELSMEHAQLKVEIRDLSELNATGKDEVNFLFAANKGSRLQHIKDVASGGEISRLTLITKSLVASAIPLPTLIFDEIDSGVSGDVALKMGNILRHLSNEHQVVSITHSPQIASKANAHYFVYKRVKENRTVTGVRQLTTDERIRAIATMLSQSPPTNSALENAKELIEMA